MPNRPSRTLWSIWDARPGSNDLLPVLPRHRRAQLVSPFGWAICGKPKSSLSPSRNRKFFNSVISRDENSLSLFAHSKTVAPARTLRLVSLLRSSERDARALARELCHIRARLTEVRPCTGSRAARTSSVPDFVHELRAHVHSADRIILRWADSHLEDPGRASVIDVLLDKHTANKQAL